MVTPPFPDNGPKASPEFDGHQLLLLMHATPPSTLEGNIKKLGSEIEEGMLGSNGVNGGEFTWPPAAGSELEAILKPEALIQVQNLAFFIQTSS